VIWCGAEPAVTLEQNYNSAMAKAFNQILNYHQMYEIDFS
jgi:hypothetical protein